jgi:micrococcal nuclease
MGKLVDVSSRQRVRGYAVKREIMAAAQRAGEVKSRTHRRAASAWDPSNQAIIGIGLAAFLLFTLMLSYWPLSTLPQSYVSGSKADAESASFGFCHSGGGTNCVVDGDTFYYRGNKIRIADIDTPETHDYRCGSELELGNRATGRLRELLNNGAFSLMNIDRDTDRYGRLLRVIERDGKSLGGVLVSEGLARWYEGGRQPWC